MWFTKVSLKNPVFATMVMLAFVVLGIFSYQRLKVDQFPNIDFPVVVITAEYPGASPEIVESEVTKKIEEGVNSISGINALTSRSFEGQSVVIMEFQLHIDGRKAAEDVREKIAAIRPTLRTEVKEPRVLRFDPSSRAVWSLAVVPDASAGKPMNAVELTNWADQVLKKRLENVRGVGAVTLVGDTRREINLYLNPQAMEALGITADQVVAAVRNENQDLPVGAGGAGGCTHPPARRFWPHHRRPQEWRRHPAGSGGEREGRCSGSRVAGAVQRSAHPAADGAEGPGRKHHRGD